MGLDPRKAVWIQFYWNYRMMDGLLYVCIMTLNEDMSMYLKWESCLSSDKHIDW